MSNFKLKHQSKSGLLRHAGWHKEFSEPKKKIYIPSEVERPIEYIPSYQKAYEPPQIPDIKKMPKPKEVDFNIEKNRIKYQNQELKRKQAEEQQMRFEESMRKHKELAQNLPKKVIPDFEQYESTVRLDPTTGKPYDDSAEGRRKRVAIEQALGMRDEMGYQTPNYEEQAQEQQMRIEPALQMVKDNSNTPYKLRHQSKTALHNNGVIGSGGGLTDDERAEANRLLDSTKNTYMSREFKRKGRFDPEQRKVVFENVPMSEEENLAEWNREKGEFYVDFDNDGNAKVLNVPRGDDDIPVQSFIKSLDPSQYQGYIPTSEDLPENYYDPGLDPDSGLNPFKGYQRIKNYRER